MHPHRVDKASLGFQNLGLGSVATRYYTAVFKNQQGSRCPDNILLFLGPRLGLAPKKEGGRMSKLSVIYFRENRANVFLSVRAESRVFCTLRRQDPSAEFILS